MNETIPPTTPTPSAPPAQQSSSQSQDKQQKHVASQEQKVVQTQQAKPQEQKQQVQQEEYDESLELQRKRLPKIYDIKANRNLVVKNSKVEVYDIQIKAADSETIIWTTVQITVNPFEQLRPFEADLKDGEKIYYMCLKGRGEVMSSELRKKIVEGQMCVVEKGVRHNLNNLSETDPFVLIAHYPGYFDARDIYKPITSAYKKAAESRQQFFASGTKEPVQEAKKEGEQQQQQQQQQAQIVKEMDKRYV